MPKLKKECFECNTFDRSQRRAFKCAVPGTCPGRDWDHARKQRAVEGQRKKYHVR